MSKEREIRVEARRQQISGMDKILSNSPDKDMRESWNRFINKSDYFELANDDDLFHRCCDIFEYMIASTAWRV